MVSLSVAYKTKDFKNQVGCVKKHLLMCVKKESDNEQQEYKSENRGKDDKE